MKSNRLYSLIITVILTSMTIMWSINLEEENIMEFKKIDLLRGTILTPSGIKSMEKQSGGKDWFYNISGLRVDGFWMPEEKDIRQAEQLVLDCLVERIKDPDNYHLQPDANKDMEFTDKEIREILEQYLSYYRHYVGLIIGSERYIYFSSFPEEDIQQGFLDEEWGSSLMVEDGGSSYWQILVGIDRNKCLCLNINGES